MLEVLSLHRRWRENLSLSLFHTHTHVHTHTHSYVRILRHICKNNMLCTRIALNQIFTVDFEDNEVDMLTKRRSLKVRFDIWLEVMNISDEIESSRISDGFVLLIHFCAKHRDYVADVMSGISRVLSSSTTTFPKLQSRLHKLFLETLNQWLEPLILASTSTKVRECTAHLISSLSSSISSGESGANRERVLHALLQLLPKLKQYTEDDNNNNNMYAPRTRRATFHLASFCDVLIDHIQTKEDLAKFEKIALKRDKEEDEDVCFLPNLVFTIDSKRRERDDDKLACMRLWIHAIETAIKCGETEMEAAKKWEIHGVETIDEENDVRNVSPAESFSNHFICLPSNEKINQDSWNAVAVSKFYDLASHLCVVHPEEQSNSFLSVFTKHDNFNWALSEIVYKRWFQFEDAIKSIFRIVRYCVKYVVCNCWSAKRENITLASPSLFLSLSLSLSHTHTQHNPTQRHIGTEKSTRQD